MDRREVLKRVGYIMGGAVSAPAAFGFLSGCGTSNVKEGAHLLLSGSQFETVSQIAETILPPTDTPGAIEAGVPGFIDIMLKEYYPPEERKRYGEELTALDEQCREKMGGSFASLEKDKQETFLTQVEEEAYNARSGENQPVYLMLKELTLLGYFTSEIGCTQALNYNKIPGEFRGCTPLEPDTKAWAT